MDRAPTAAALLPARERILATAHDLFYRHGVRATGIDRVIAEARVTKVTFYRHFPSKNDLVLAYLEARHEHWMQWFRAALERHRAVSPGAAALIPALGEWLRSPGYRGCGFLNSVSELAEELPAVLEVTRRHKREMAAAVETLLPAGAGRARRTRALCIALDGAIVHAQFGEPVDDVLRGLQLLMQGMLTEGE
ncbi:TetR/AcrR family transcriptional regulator [Schlegelella sp. S2-27]|uniref:TetR/AcrR family transcriptional regulator n=1 Tax=Caldimonas mangrovi TaxID=2944811 RepID=A0ABT0YMU6_9BURK|nr:TetR/AcrR family transcriptional regulator [Caldimonas mangrovi]MCM5680047.1 TetR/AcrR family transcriptional regulator [Caldimonas mangrovi]